MIASNPMDDKNLAQKDEDLIKNIAGEMNSKDKKNNKSQSEIEEKIEHGYIKLKSDIKKTLTPILQALTDMGVDGGKIATVESEIYSNAKVSFFNKVLNSGENNLEEISKLVHQESIKVLSPLFIDGEISQDLTQLKPKTQEEINVILKDLLEIKEPENIEIEKSNEFYGLKDKTYKELGIDKFDENNKVVEKSIDDISDEWFDKMEKAASSGDKVAKAKLTALSTAYSYMEFDKDYNECKDYEQADILININNLGRIINETGDKEIIKITTQMLEKIGLSELIVTDKNGLITINMSKLKEMGEFINTTIETGNILETDYGSEYEKYGSKEALKEEAIIVRTQEFLRKKYDQIFERFVSGEITEEEFNAVVLMNLDASNRYLSLFHLACNQIYNEENVNAYNLTMKTVLEANLKAPDSFMTGYVMRDLAEQIQYIFNSGIAGVLSDENLELFESVINRSQEYIQAHPNADGMPSGIAEIFEEQAKRVEAIKSGKLELAYGENSKIAEQIENYQMEYKTSCEVSKIFENFREGKFDSEYIEEVFECNNQVLNKQMLGLDKYVNEVDTSEQDKSCYNYLLNVILQKKSEKICDVESLKDFKNTLIMMDSKVFDEICSIKNLKSMRDLLDEKSNEFELTILDKSLVNKLSKIIDARTINEKGNESEFDVRKKSNLSKIATSKNVKYGSVKTQEWLEHMILNDDVNKDLIAEVAVDYLEKQKESSGRFDEETDKDARKGLYESIVLAGITNEKIFERMLNIDKETSRYVVDEMLQQINDSRASINKVLGAVQSLGRGLKGPIKDVVQDTKIEFLDTSKTKMPNVNMFAKKENVQEKDGGREPGE